MENLLGILRQPFPLHLPSASALRLRIGIAVLVYLFLFIFKPFGIAYCHGEYLALIVGGYSLIAFLVMWFFEEVVQRRFSRIFREDNWTVGKAVAWIWFITFVVGIVNAFYHWWLDPGKGGIEGLHIFAFTLIVGVFPFSLWIVWRFAMLYRHYKQQAESLSVLVSPSTHVEKEKHDAYDIVLFQDHKKTKVAIPARDILFIESAQNYIVIYSGTPENIQKTMLRCTLQQAEDVVRGKHDLVRCHRSFIVNLTKVASLGGNAQGYKLVMNSIDKVVPVSRKYEKEIVSSLRRFKAVSHDSQLSQRASYSSQR